MLIVVDLPAPLGPRNANTSPARTSKLIAHGRELAEALRQAADLDRGHLGVDVADLLLEIRRTHQPSTAGSAATRRVAGCPDRPALG